MRWLVLACLILAVPVLAADPGANTFEIYPIPFSDLKATESVAKSIVGDGGTVVLDEKNQRLLVATTTEKHRQLADMIGKLNVVPRNVRIDVEFRGRQDKNASEASVAGNGEVTREDGITHTTIRIKPKLIDETTHGASRVHQTLMVASGRAGYLNIGQQVPYVEWLTDYGMRSGIIQKQVSWQNVGSRLVVEPLVLGEGPMIRIRVTPELSGMVDGHPLQTRFSSATTELVVQDGQTIQLGGMNQDSEVYSKFLVGTSDAGAQEALDIFLTPHIMNPVTPDSRRKENQ